MAELRLVNKDALLAEWDKQSPRGHYEFDQTIMEFPTTTEAEIRAKALDEVLAKVNTMNLWDSRDKDMFRLVVEQLKEE